MQINSGASVKGNDILQLDNWQVENIHSLTQCMYMHTFIYVRTRSRTHLGTCCRRDYSDVKYKRCFEKSAQKVKLNKTKLPVINNFQELSTFLTSIIQTLSILVEALTEVRSLQNIIIEFLFPTFSHAIVSQNHSLKSETTAIVC